LIEYVEKTSILIEMPQIVDIKSI